MTALVRPLVNRAAFERDWRALERHAAEPPFFLRWPWIAALLDAGEGGAFRTVRVKRDDEDVLLGLCAQTHDPVHGGSLWLTESGDPVLDRACVEYNDFLTSGDAPPEVREQALEALFRDSANVRRFVFRWCTDDLRAAIEGAAQGFHLRIAGETRSWVAPLNLRRDEGRMYLDGLSANTRGQIERAMRVYDARGGLRIETADAADANAWADFRALHAARWADRGGDVFANPKVAALHASLRDAGIGVHLLRISSGSTTIGMLYNFIADKRVLNYQSGFRYEADNRLKPGMVSHALAAQRYLDTGYDAYDLLGGDAQYKESLASPGARLSTVVAERPGLRTSVIDALRRVRRAGMRRT